MSSVFNKIYPAASSNSSSNSGDSSNKNMASQQLETPQQSSKLPQQPSKQPQQPSKQQTVTVYKSDSTKTTLLKNSSLSCQQGYFSNMSSTPSRRFVLTSSVTSGSA
ncbi:hypothetical protein HELRODRAFT_184602, partial [Helobdella robusta]|uniref:Uncharacterized protein n=1 Tax=Helobdella robusta TaxID=6412 RepID=T1FLK2_HELRO